MGVNIQTIKDIRIYLAKELEDICQEPEKGAISNIILKTVTGLTKLHQLYDAETTVSKSHIKRIVTICADLKTGKPLQYILGETSFYDCVIKVNRSTLIPRPETEELVDHIIRENKGYCGNILDIGTGSGCIAVALAANITGSRVTGIDNSKEAINTAKENALLNNVDVQFLIADILDYDLAFNTITGIIVSNPPYVQNSEMQSMKKNVLGFEPHSALFVPDSDPLLYYKAILNHSEKILIPGGLIYFEINEVMGSAMVHLLESSGYTDICIIKDINDKDRIIKGMKNG